MYKVSALYFLDINKTKVTLRFFFLTLLSFNQQNKNLFETIITPTFFLLNSFHIKINQVSILAYLAIPKTSTFASKTVNGKIVEDKFVILSN